MGKNNLILLISSVVLIGIGTMSGLYYWTQSDSPYQHGFTRQFIPIDLLAPTDSLPIGYDSYYIAGNTKHFIYLGNIVAPRHVLEINLATLDTQHIILELINPEHRVFQSVRVKVDSPRVYLADGTVPVIFGGSLRDEKVYPLSDIRNYFLEYLPKNSHTFFLRSVNGASEGRIGRIVLAPYESDFPEGLLSKQIDGIFCTDGVMQYEPERGWLVYLYYYRNQFLVMDTLLRVITRGHTIDTVNTVKIEVADEADRRSRRFSKPPLLVNRQSAVSDCRLFVNSSLVSDNESYEKFTSSCVLDIYHLQTGLYEGSFYVPEREGKKFRHFRIIGEKLIALYEREIVLYNLMSLRCE